MPFTLDGDDHLADARAQRRVDEQLRELGVRGLWDQHYRSAERKLLVTEYRQIRKEIQWRAIAPFYYKTQKEWEKADRTLRAAGLEWPSNADVDGLLTYLEAVSAPARELLAWRPPGDDRSPRAAQVALRRASVRVRISASKSTARGLGRFTAAVQQRFMPEMRRLTYVAIAAAIAKRLDLKDAAYLEQHPNADKDQLRETSRRGLKAQASKLAADYIRAFYPTFGKTTNSANVRMTLKSDD